MMQSDVELSCAGCGLRAVVRSAVLNSYGVIARPSGWTHGGKGLAVIGAKDYCPSCSPIAGGTPWEQTASPRRRTGEMLAVLVLED
jgi:hypothetical protein